jgi:hypothetical protein
MRTLLAQATSYGSKSSQQSYGTGSSNIRATLRQSAVAMYGIQFSAAECNEANILQHQQMLKPSLNLNNVRLAQKIGHPLILDQSPIAVAAANMLLLEVSSAAQGGHCRLWVSFYCVFRETSSFSSAQAD